MAARAWMITATLDATLEWSLAPPDELEAAWNQVPQLVQAFGAENDLSFYDLGHWAGAPRITRQNRGTGYRMTIAAPWVVPGITAEQLEAAGHDGHTDPVGVELVYQRTAADIAVAKVRGLLTQEDTAWTVVRTDWRANMNGALDWWASGQAARTQTRFAAPGFFGAGAPVENPVGPNSPDLRPATAGELVQGAGLAAFKGAAPVLVAIGGILVLVYVTSGSRT